MTEKERRELSQGVKFVEEVVFLSLYGNWLISFIDKMNFPFNDNLSLVDGLIISLEAPFILISIMSLGFYFMKKTDRNKHFLLFTGALLSTIQGIELYYSQNWELKQIFFFSIGLFILYYFNISDENKKLFNLNRFYE